MSPPPELVDRLLARLHQVRDLLGFEPLPADAQTRFADAVDSMAFVDFLALAAEDCGVSVEAIEQAAGRRYGTIAELATALHAAGLSAAGALTQPRSPTLGRPTQPRSPVSLAATAAVLPARKQHAHEINALLHRPPGWLEEHAGIQRRGVWGEEDALDAAACAARACLARAGLPLHAVSALLVTSEAPPLLAGLAAALHHRLQLSSDVGALEIGGACSGFLTALWIGQRLLTEMSAVLVLAVEAPSRWLTVEPGPAGEAAALFGDAAAACLLTAHRPHAAAISLRDIFLATDGSAGALLRPHHESGRGVLLHMDGVPLAHRAVRVMAEAVTGMSARHGLMPDQLAAIVAHGGNGRMPALLARRLNLPLESICSTTHQTGNLGPASLPVAWASHAGRLHGPMIWTAAGAGLQWGAALFDPAPDSAIRQKMENEIHFT